MYLKNNFYIFHSFLWFLLIIALQKPSTYFKEIEVHVGPGTSCGGHFIFAEICDADNKKCCMDQITPDPYKGFKAGSNFNGKFRNCTTMDVRTTPPDYILKLSSFNEITVWKIMYLPLSNK